MSHPLLGRGAFGECSKSTDKLFKTCALQAEASDAGIELTPETDTPKSILVLCYLY